MQTYKLSIRVVLRSLVKGGDEYTVSVVAAGATVPGLMDRQPWNYNSGLGEVCGNRVVKC